MARRDGRTATTGWRERVVRLPLGRSALVAYASASVLLLAAFALDAVTLAPRLSAVVGALAFAALVGMGVLYAWRPPTASGV